MSTRWEDIGTLARRRRAENPGPMTLDGTNSYVLSAPESAALVVVDPGPLLDSHLAELAATGAVELILITHHHGDHTDGSAALHELTGAPVRAARAEFCHNSEPLYDGELIQAAGLTIEVLATPGHTSDSVCFAICAELPQLPDQPAQPGQRTERIVLTGDTILGNSSTVICYPDGTLGDYLTTLATLRRWGEEKGTPGPAVAGLPGHGPVLVDISAAALAYQNHRGERIAQVRNAVEYLAKENGSAPSVEAVTAAVYGDIPANLEPAARLSVEAQLHYIKNGGTVGL